MRRKQKGKLERLKKIVNNIYEYRFKEPKGMSQYYEKNVFYRYRQYIISENGSLYSYYLGTDEIAETPNRFFSAFALFPSVVNEMLLKRKEFIGHMKYYYHFNDYSVAARARVLGFCKAELPDELFRVPPGYKKVEEKFETILEMF